MSGCAVRALSLALVCIACAGAPRTVVAPEKLPLLERCEAIAAERDRAWEGAWEWEEQMRVAARFWQAAAEAGCEELGPEWSL
jgi:hypothetical protein